MAAITELRERSDRLFTDLLEAQTTPPAGAPKARGFDPAATAEPFSWFDPEQGMAAAGLSFGLAALVASKEDPRDGLAAALGQVEAAAGSADPEQVRQGFALFVTHNAHGRLLAKPRTVAAAPRLFSPPPKGGDELRRISIGGLSPDLDYWREDVLANEHHQHWHEVYPFTGLPPRDFREWVREREPAQLVAILDVLQPDPEWAKVVAESSETQLAELFGQAARHENVPRLPRELYRLMFRLNDRQGEIFFYMHSQMLARYDAELLAAGRERVKPFGPDAWDDAIAAGYDPEDPQRFFARREPGAVLPSASIERLAGMHKPIADAIKAGRLNGADGKPVPIDRTNLGEAVEATVGHLHALDPASYPGLHNSGHMRLSELSPPRGVMSNPVAAIRDQVFWEWHKFIDDLSASWQQKQPPFAFDDAPEALLRDVILCRTGDLPAGEDPEALGEQLFGGANWEQDFSGATAGAGAVAPVDELVTSIASANFGGKAIQYLTHEAFSYFLRVENKTAADLALTARIFLAPAAHAEDRRAWIEMDKFLVTVPAQSKTVVHRPDTESAVVKRPVDRSPADIQAPNGASDKGSYCDCGWPYTLLLPRGTAAGADYKLLALLTDAAIDQVAAPAECGSMSWCGAVDRYPDTRDMGYPFCRPFAGGADAIAKTFSALPSAATRALKIRHV
ncbi:MAG TPA: tyrosinase family protein [Solirubrobacterales bacterium]|jgi:hypothetical protein|nr:tyrosinase family protein [Solirubrobacterales bacterium]